MIDLEKIQPEEDGKKEGQPSARLSRSPISAEPTPGL